MRADLLLHDYELKLDYLRNHYDRLWTRFNYFLGAELALFGFLGYLSFDKPHPTATLLPIALGVGVSALWYVVGAQDRALVEIYRDRATEAAAAFGRDADGIAGYEVNHAGARAERQWRSLRSWYLPAISITQMPATIALLLFAAWLVLLFTWRRFIGL